METGDAYTPVEILHNKYWAGTGAQFRQSIRGILERVFFFNKTIYKFTLRQSLVTFWQSIVMFIFSSMKSFHQFLLKKRIPATHFKPKLKDLVFLWNFLLDERAKWLLAVIYEKCRMKKLEHCVRENISWWMASNRLKATTGRWNRLTVEVAFNCLLKLSESLSSWGQVTHPSKLWTTC